jgi:primosomal protein N' (replication factor Y)
VLVQTCHSDHPLLQSLARGHYLPVADQLLEERKTGALPPFRAMAIFRADSITMINTIQFLENIRNRFGSDRLSEGLEVWGPLPAIIARRADRHRAQLIILSNSRLRLNHNLTRLCFGLENERSHPQVRWHIDVDPTDTA